MGFLALVMLAAGTLLGYSGRHGYAPADTFRWVLHSNDPGVSPPELKYPLPAVAAPQTFGRKLNQSDPAPGGGATFTPVSFGSGARGAQLAADVTRYLGIRYRFGGHDPSTGFDCSGLPTWALHHDLGVQLPNNVHTVVSQFRTWSGARTVTGPAQPGDLVIYGVEHMGVAVSSSEMVAAPHTGTVVQRQHIYGSPMLRRVIV